MKTIVEEFKKEEYQSGISRKVVIDHENSVFISNQRQQRVIVDIEGEERISYYDESTYALGEAIAYCFFEIENYKKEITDHLIRSQLLIGIFHDKIHIGVQPWVEFNVSVKERESNADCIIEILYPDGVCPYFSHFFSKLDWFQNKLEKVANSSFISYSKEMIEEFLQDGEKKGISYGEDGDSYYDSDSDDFETNYRSRSIEEQGYDDYDYLYGNNSSEPDFDEDYYEEQALAEYEEYLRLYFNYIFNIEVFD